MRTIGMIAKTENLILYYWEIYTPSFDQHLTPCLVRFDLKGNVAARVFTMKDGACGYYFFWYLPNGETSLKDYDAPLNSITDAMNIVDKCLEENGFILLSENRSEAIKLLL